MYSGSRNGGEQGHEIASTSKEDKQTRKSSRQNNQNSQSSGQNSQVNSSQLINPTTEIGENLTLTDNDRQGLTGFSDGQWKTLVKLLNPTNLNFNMNRLSGKNDDPTWILDIGATHHMNGHLDLLQNIQFVSPILVRLPAGANVLATQRGTIRLTTHILTECVLCGRLPH